MPFVASLPGGRSVRAAFSERSDGDFAIAAPPSDLHAVRQRLLSGPWTALDQVHGARVLHVLAPHEHLGAQGDALVATTPGVVVAVQTADCVPVLFASIDGEPVIGAAHAGWRGLYDGVIEATAQRMRELGATSVRAWIGPCIAAAAYEFGQRELTSMALRFGPDVVAATALGTPALDVLAATRIALREARIDEVDDSAARCTATTLDSAGMPRYFSHRARGDRGRQAAAIRIDP